MACLELVDERFRNAEVASTWEPSNRAQSKWERLKVDLKERSEMKPHFYGMSMKVSSSFGRFTSKCGLKGADDARRIGDRGGETSYVCPVRSNKELLWVLGLLVPM